MNRSNLMPICAAAALAAVLAGGCASPFHRTAHLEIRPLGTTPASLAPDQAAARPTFYSAAVKAIEARDYARALDLLQAARAENPDDVAVLNAFGVVYDKLGRLDLSARYYARAHALDPDSEIVRRNVAYSDRLRDAEGREAQPAAFAALAPPPKAEPAPAALTLASAPPPVPLIRVAANGALLMGHGLKIVDASGDAGGAEALRKRLAQSGWSVQRRLAAGSDPQPQTAIVYPREGAAVAGALARTLPGRVTMSICEDGCVQVVLIVGQDLAMRASGARS